MNRSYRIVFNRSSGLWQVVSELARSHGKGRGQSNAVCTIKPKTRQARSGGRTLAWSQLVAMLASVFALGNAHGFSRTGDYRVVGQDYIFGITQAGALIFDSELSEHGDPYNIILGQQATGDGTLSLTRATYNIGTSASARLVAGSQGTGTVNLGSGATLRITNPLNPSTPPAGRLILGEHTTGRGTLNIGGQAGAPAESGGTLVATGVQFGAGTGVINFNVTGEHIFNLGLVSMSAQGTHSVNQLAGTTRLTGDSSGYTGAITISGGTLKVENKLRARETLIDAGTAAGSQAEAIASGAGVEWRNTGNLSVGKTGAGSLTIKEGAKVFNQFGIVNAPAASTARALVSGANSVWDNQEALSVGNSGHGSVVIESGGLLKSKDGYIGQNTASSGTITLNGTGSSWQNSGALRVGDVSGQGELNIESGATVSNTDALVGSMDGTGHVTVVGTGSTWSNTGTVSVASGIGNAKGTLTIADGGAVRVGVNGTGALALGLDGVFPLWMPHGVLNIGAPAEQAARAAGHLTAASVQMGSGRADINFNHTDANYTFSAALISAGNGAFHNVNQLAGTTVLSADNSAFQGTTTVSGGKLLVLGALGGGAAVQSGGTLQFGNALTGASTSLNRDLSVTGAGSTLAIYGPASLKILANTVSLGSDTQLDILAGANGPALQAQRVTLGNNVTFRLNGITNASQLDTTLIQTTSGISGDFATVNVGGFQGTVDYMTIHTRKSADETQYLASYAPSWTAANNLAHGTFTLTNSTDAFEMGLDLEDQAANSATGWDGKSLTKAGAGTLLLSGNNAYTGGTVLNGGTLQIQKVANLGTGGLTFNGGALNALESMALSHTAALQQNATLDVNAGKTLSLHGAIQGTADLIKTGTGTLSLSNSANDYANTQVLAGTLIGHAASISGNLRSEGTTIFSQSSNARYDGTISGAGALIKQGAGTLTLPGDQSGFTGTTTVAGGTLLIQNKLGGSANVTAGTLQLGDGTASAASTLTALTVHGASSTLALRGPATLAVNGGADLGDNTVLDIGVGAATPSLYAHQMTLGQNIVLKLGGIASPDTVDRVLIDTRDGISGDFAAVSIGGFTGDVDYLTVNTGKSEDQRRYHARYGLSWGAGNNLSHGTFTLAQASDRFEVSADLSDQAANAATQWNGRSLTKTGQGTLVLSGNNSYNGNTLLNQGTVEVSRDANLGASNGTVSLNGGTLATTASFNSARAFSLAQTGSLNVATGATLGLSGVIDGTGTLHKTGSGTLALSGQNTYLGGTLVQGGSVQVSQDANLGASSGTVSLNGGTLATTASFNSARAFTLAQTGGLNVATGTTLGLSGAINGTGALHKTGAGTLALSGVNTFGGGTTLTQGVLQVSQNANLGSGALDFQGGTLHTTASLDMTRDLALSQAARLDVATGTTLTLNGKLAGVGDLIKSGNGTLRLNNTANAYAHTQISSGTLISNAAALSGNVANNGALVFEQAVNGTFNGVLSGSGSTLKTGAGALTLAGLSAGYTGHTTVNGGTLAVLGTLGGSASVSNGTLQFGNGVTGAASSLRDSLTVSGVGSTLSVQGPATLSVADAIQMRDGTQLDLVAGPGSAALQADSLTLGQNVAFTLGGIADSSQLDKVLINTRNGIQGGFASVRVGGFNGAVDYLSLNTHTSADNKQLLASYNLSWTAANNLAHGTFTLTDAANRFVVSTGLRDQTANATTGWNGTTLTKAGAGTLVLTGDNRYTGGTVLAGGTLQVDRDANLGDARGSLSFQGGTLATQGSFSTARNIALMQDGRFEVNAGTTLALAGAISGHADLVKSGSGSLRLESSANAYQTTRILAGTLIGHAGVIPGNVANHGTLVLDQATNATYAGDLSGDGQLIKAGPGILHLTGDSSGFSGTTLVESGKIAMNGRLGGSSTIGAGSVLSGSGVVGSGPGTRMTVANGGTLTPGNSIGTLTIDGDLDIQPGARFAVETQPQDTAADLVKVTGNATLNGGSVAHIGFTGKYDLRSSYTILAVDGTLSGRFDDVTSDFAFLTPSLAYDYSAGRVALLLDRNEKSMDSAAQTRNQRATAHAIDRIGVSAAHGVYDAIAQLPNDRDLLRAGFDGLSGEIHASAKSVLLEDSQHIRNTINERLRSATQAVASSSLTVRTDDGQLAPGHAAGTSSWIQATGAWRDTDSDGNAADLSSSSSGFLMGVDSPVSDTLRLGLLAGYSRTDIDVDDRASTARSDNYHLGAYGGAQWGALGLRSGLTYSWHDIASRRQLAIPGLSEKLKADYKANSTQIFADLGYRIDTAPVAIEPFAQLAYVHLQSKGFKEEGGVAALQAQRQSTETTFATLGVRAMSEFELGGAQASVRGSLGWRHASGTLNPTATHAFSAGSAFTVAGAPIAKNSALMQAGLDVQLNRSASVGLAYQGQIARSAQDHSVQARLNIRF